eukprot:TRINITY_DN2589_c0_g1_i2.p1 TRINITY_DN2589_c0_g1~~TRINITY_DN2589_c0_g1_i2.p1  ORF type:complete len:568 (+),score=55.52 TRINITY_DN2589_c0_g1_i2:226-1929(+)
MEELDVELLTYIVDAGSWEPSIIAKIACLSRGLADTARTVLWPRYCKRCFPEVTESVIESLKRAIPEPVIATMVCGKPAESLPATSLATSADSSVEPVPEGGWARLAFLFSVCAAPPTGPTHLSLEVKFTTEYARNIFVSPDSDVIWAAKCMRAPDAPPDVDDGREPLSDDEGHEESLSEEAAHEESPSEDAAYEEHMQDDAAHEEHLPGDAAHGEEDWFRGLIINFEASWIYNDLSVSGLVPPALTTVKSTPLHPIRTAETAAKQAGQQNKREAREESRALSNCPSSSTLNPPGPSTVTGTLCTWEGEEEKEDISDLSHRQKEEDHDNNVQGSHIQAPLPSRPLLPPQSHLSTTSTATIASTSAAPFSAMTTTPSCSRPSPGTTLSVPIEDLKLEGGSTSADMVERELAMFAGAAARDVDTTTRRRRCVLIPSYDYRRVAALMEGKFLFPEVPVAQDVDSATKIRCIYCNSKGIAWWASDPKLELSDDIIHFYICAKGHFYGKLRIKPDMGEGYTPGYTPDYSPEYVSPRIYYDEDFSEENDFTLSSSAGKRRSHKMRQSLPQHFS